MTKKQKRRRTHRKQVKRHQMAARNKGRKKREQPDFALPIVEERKDIPVMEKRKDLPIMEEQKDLSLSVAKERKRKRRKKHIRKKTPVLFLLVFLASLLEAVEQKRRQIRKERSWKRRIPSLWSQPFTCWSNGECVRIWIGKKVLHLSGKKKGNRFLVPVKNLHHWGIGNGPWLSADEQVELIHLIQEKTRPNPYLKVVFR